MRYWRHLALVASCGLFLFGSLSEAPAFERVAKYSTPRVAPMSSPLTLKTFPIKPKIVPYVEVHEDFVRLHWLTRDGNHVGAVYFPKSGHYEARAGKAMDPMATKHSWQGTLPKGSRGMKNLIDVLRWESWIQLNKSAACNN